MEPPGFNSLVAERAVVAGACRYLDPFPTNLCILDRCSEALGLVSNAG